MSPDGRYIAVNVNNGSNASRNSPRYHAAGVLQLWRIEAGRLLKVAGDSDRRVGAGRGLEPRTAARWLSPDMVGLSFHRSLLVRWPSDLRPLATLEMPTGPAATTHRRAMIPPPHFVAWPSYRSGAALAWGAAQSAGVLQRALWRDRQGGAVDAFTLKNSHGMSVRISTTVASSTSSRA